MLSTNVTVDINDEILHIDIQII